MLDDVKTILSIINKYYNKYIFDEFDGFNDLIDTEKKFVKDIISDITCEICDIDVDGRFQFEGIKKQQDL